jgi:hypothetical protein
MIIPIQFGIAASKIVQSVPQKILLQAPLIPGNLETYIYKDEDSYYTSYQKSIFGLTMKKAGWDCLRHYEILGNGCIPYFIGLENCPKSTMVLLPKDLILKAMENAGSPDFNYIETIQELLDYTRKHLTTEAIARYMLQKSGNESAKSALYLWNYCSAHTWPDYLRTTIIHGFKMLFGKECHDCISYDSLYTDYPEWKLHPDTKGMSITRLLDRDEMRDASRDATVEQDILNMRYDVIIYDVHETMPYHDLVTKVYPPSKILYTCGVDIQPGNGCNHFALVKDSPFFWREIPDHIQIDS